MLKKNFNLDKFYYIQLQNCCIGRFSTKLFKFIALSKLTSKETNFKFKIFTYKVFKKPNNLKKKNIDFLPLRENLTLLRSSCLQ